MKILYYTSLSLLVSVCAVYIALRQLLYLPPNFVPNYDSAQYTIRVNTFRRNDLLELFLDHYTQCEDVKSIQVVWSDQKYSVPKDIRAKYSKEKVLFEGHTTDRLSNRFKAILPIETDAVLSVDDDILVPCNKLTLAHQVWLANQRVLVGFAPRQHAYNPITGAMQYLRWQHTWWNGVYSIMLTKVSFFHKDYLNDFFEVLPESLIEKIDKNRNCEDIAMAYVIAKKSNAAPVWVKSIVYEEAESGISAQDSHFENRGDCLTELAALDKASPWVVGYQKIVPISMANDWPKLLWQRI